MTDASYAIMEILLWGNIATLVMTAIAYVSQNFGWSRLSLPFLLGTLFTDDRHTANVLGFLLYFMVGLLFALFYYLIFVTVGFAKTWLGALAGLLHGVLVIAVFLPLLPHLHPRMASKYDGPSETRRLEPPGFFGLHYGYRTPLVMLLAQAAYGAVLGAGYKI